LNQKDERSVRDQARTAQDAKLEFREPKQVLASIRSALQQPNLLAGREDFAQLAGARLSWPQRM
jgi:hypothetical protein